MKKDFIIKTGIIFSVILMALMLTSCDKKGQNNDIPKTTEPTNIDHLTKNAIDLRFGTDGNFKVVIFSDLNESLEVSSEVIKYMNKILDKENPGLIILGGNMHDGSITDGNSLKAFLDIIIEPIESRKIPWCHVYGTGSNEIYNEIPKEMQEDIYQSYQYCISKKGEEDLYGFSNYVLPILRNDNDKIAYNVWILDTHSFLDNYVNGLEEEVLLKRSLGGGQNLDTLHFSQVKWYWDTSVLLESYNGKEIPGIMYFHTPLHEFNYIYKNSDVTNMQGQQKKYKVNSPEVNSGILWTCYEKGDIKAILCGYDRSNDFSGIYMDILLGYCSTIGRDSDQSTRGARVVQLNQNEENDLSTWISYIHDIN